jgi:hypothetical protein
MVELGGQPIHKIQPTTLGVPLKAHKSEELAGAEKLNHL